VKCNFFLNREFYLKIKIMRLSLIFISLFSVIQAQAQEKEPTNKHFWYSMKTSASPEKIWTIWTDVQNWKNWDIGLKDTFTENTFLLGSKGIITSLEGRKSKFKVVEFNEGISYTYKTRLPLGSLYVRRYLTLENNETIYTHEVWFKGITKGIFAKTFGGKFRKMLPEVLQNIKQIAESNNTN